MSLDPARLGFARATSCSTGRPTYDPADLLKLYTYGYLNRVRSSRLLEREAGCNVEEKKENQQCLLWWRPLSNNKARHYC